MSVDSTSAADPARAKIAGSIRQAAQATGTSFQYLVSAAKIESNLDPTAAAPTSSARGLFQFIEQTWLGTVKEAGKFFGFGNFADAISKSPAGTYSVSDPAARREILKLRDDPAASAAMAGVLTQSNAFKLTGALGRQPTDGELYIAHFMGVGAASRLISNAENNPRASGAALFPAAAAANRSIFYNRDGAARSVSDVYSVLTSRYASAANSALTRTAMASAGTPVSDSPPVPASSAAYLTSFPQTPAPVAQVASVPSDNAPMFRSLFQAGDRPEPVSPMVRELWGDRSAAAPSSGGLDLFSDRNGTFSG